MFFFGIVTLILFIISIVLIYVYLTWHFDHWTRLKIPGPKPRVLLGTFPGTVTASRNFIYDLDEVYKQYRKKTKFVGVFMTRNPQILILDPILTKEILINNFKCFMNNESSRWLDRIKEPISGNNPFVLPAAEWKVKRAELVPGLTLSKIKGMYPIIQVICKKLKKYLLDELESGETVFDAKDFSLRFTGEVVADVAWGIEAGTFKHSSKKPQEECTFLDMSKRMIAQTFVAFFYFFIFGIFPFFRRFVHVRFFPQLTDRFYLKLTKMATEMRRSGNTESIRQDLLQHLVDLQDKKQLEDWEVVAHQLTFLFDGFETSATLISHCLLLLARYPATQMKLRQEINENLSATEDCISFDELMRLPYLEQCVAETLRIFTPLPFMSKICTEAYELENNDGVRLQVHTGDICLISLHSLHHDEDYYAEPETFMPERFSDENGGTKKYKDMGVYLPFGDGPRICLGMKFGLAQAKAAIVEVIKNFEVTVNERTRTDNMQEASGFIVGLQGGIHLNLRRI